ncbi:MAG: hypothetical protein JOY98_07540 [Candidatus Eremiobacteraeota bacterium]|nr:hypothetical protein [Candidatus Eremiobacteraeota bacterium]
MRYLLHRVRKPYELVHAPYIKQLCSAVGEPNAAQALRRLVEEALPGSTYAEARLRSLILRMDFDDALTGEEAAKDAHLSRRQVQRMRAEAVRMIAYRLRALVDGGWETVPVPASHRPLAELAMVAAATSIPLTSDWTARFEREYQAFARARERSHALEMRAIAGSLHRLASDSTFTLALRCQAEAELRLGRNALAAGILEDAAKRAFDRKESIEFAAVTWLRAEIHHFQGATETAHELAAGALKVLKPPCSEWIAGQLLAARVSLARRVPWFVPPEADVLATDSNGAVSFAVVEAQLAAAHSDWKRVRELAEPALLRAETSEFDGAAAAAAAVLSLAHRACGELDEALRLRARALRALLRSQDYLCANRLFGNVPQVGNATIEDALLDVLYERIGLLVPQIVNDDADQIDAVRRLIAEIVARALDRFRPRRSIEAAAERVRALDSAFASYGPSAFDAIEEMLTLALVALAGQRCWSGQHPVLGETLAGIRQAFAGCRPAGLLVGYPASRLGGALEPSMIRRLPVIDQISST